MVQEFPWRLKKDLPKTQVAGLAGETQVTETGLTVSCLATELQLPTPCPSRWLSLPFPDGCLNTLVLPLSRNTLPSPAFAFEWHCKAPKGIMYIQEAHRAERHLLSHQDHLHVTNAPLCATPFTRHWFKGVIFASLMPIESPVSKPSYSYKPSPNVKTDCIHGQFIPIYSYWHMNTLYTFT